MPSRCREPCSGELGFDKGASELLLETGRENRGLLFTFGLLFTSGLFDACGLTSPSVKVDSRSLLTFLRFPGKDEPFKTYGDARRSWPDERPCVLLMAGLYNADKSKGKPMIHKLSFFKLRYFIP